MAQRCPRCLNPDCELLLAYLLPAWPTTACFHQDYLKGHPKYKDCPIDECEICSYRDCPKHDMLHYHHDGCPRC